MAVPCIVPLERFGLDARGRIHSALRDRNDRGGDGREGDDLGGGRGRVRGRLRRAAPQLDWAWRARLSTAWPPDWSRRVETVLVVGIGALVVALILMAILVPVRGGLGPVFLVPGAAGFLYRWVRRYRGVPPALIWTTVEVTSVFLLGVTSGGVQMPHGLLALALVYAGLWYRSFGTPWLHVATGVVLYLAAYVGGALIATDRALPDPEVLVGLAQAPGFAVSAIVFRILAEVLTRHARGAARERVLLRAGRALAGAPSAEEVLAATVEAIQGMGGPAGAMVRVSAETVGGGWITASARPGAPVHVTRTEAPALPWTHAADLQSGRAVSGPLREADRRALGINEAGENAVVVPLMRGGRVAGLIVVATEAEPEDGWLPALEALAQPVVLALDRLASTDDLRRREASYRALVQYSSDMLLVVGPDSRIRYQTPAVERLLGYSSAEIVGRRLVELVHPDDARTVAAFIDAVAANPGRSDPVEWRFKRLDGSWLHAETVGTNLLGEANVGGIVLTTRDVSGRKAVEEEWRRRAYHDPLTDLPNRAYLMERLHAALADGQRRSDAVAVLFVDLDGFKEVNDSRGHEAGDRLLVVIGHRLRSAVREQDLVARLGGDEFAIVLVNAVVPRDAVQAAERVLARLSEPLKIDGQAVSVSASIGIALGTPDSDRPVSLLRRADAALYAAKGSGKARYVLYDESLEPPAWGQGQMARELSAALGSGALAVHYQPLVVLRDGRIGEVEALLRWDHPQRGLLLPGEFLDVAERTGLILPIGYWALAEACRQVLEWQRQLPGSVPLTLAVNLSARQLVEPGVAAAIGRVLEQTNFDPKHLRVEVSEAVVLEYPDAVAALRDLRDLGVRIAIDDFGAVSAALAPLTRLPVDALKISGAWVAALETDARKAALVRGAVAFAKALDLTVIAEGVETASQVQHLRALGFDGGQGFYFGGPLARDAAARLIRWQARRAVESRQAVPEALVIPEA